MAQYNKNQHGGVNPQTDEHGNIIRQPGQGGLGEQIKEHIPGMGQTDDCKAHQHSGTGATNAPGGGGLGGQIKEGMPGMGHRDDRPRNTTGTGATTTPGGVGLGEKMKENIPGMGHKDDKPGHTTGAGDGGGFGMSGEGQRDQHGQEKKGAMDKIKEKLPGHRGN
ncbi:hypothetical protein LWI29_008116 [Acer saccharum]|uniref:Dehydrin n=1 Tax=Acer saccharum TaxID=4024 RepID=A0AA39TCW9_ACESA|nr:hypothetical protein LWI29_008116 [Acer saccharum]